MARSSAENFLSSALISLGWEEPSMATQVRLLPGVTPVQPGTPKAGRGAGVFDLEFDGRVIALKLDNGETSLTVTTGKDGVLEAEDGTVTSYHIEAVLTAMDNGVSIPVIVWAPLKDGGWRLRRYDFGRLYRRLGMVRAQEGQGKKMPKGEYSHPCLWGDTTRRYEAKKRGLTIYHYKLLTLNMRGAHHHAPDEMEEAVVSSIEEMSEVLKGWARG